LANGDLLKLSHRFRGYRDLYAFALNTIAIIAGVAVFIAAEIDGVHLAGLFVGKAMSLASMAGATLILIPLWTAIRQNAFQLARILVAGQVALVLVGRFPCSSP
jgi:hypothetical protein